jgi:hypothetical protein
MAADIDPTSPKERLTRSREALLLQMQGGDRRAASRTAGPLPVGTSAFDATVPVDPLAPPITGGRDFAARGRPRQRFTDRFVWTSVGRSVIERWWQRHPANAAGQLARPLLERYARQEPVKLVAGAAAVGSLIVLVKPWRLLSITAVIAALLKTSDVADLVTTLLHRDTKKEHP